MSNLDKNVTEAVFDETDTVQVLALDGGGLKGLHTASVIKSLEDQLGHSIREHFDIITGTSTGGLIALALSIGKTGEEIEKFYLDYGHQIFPSRGVEGFFRSKRHWIGAKYSNHKLKETLLELLCQSEDKQPLLRDSQCRLIVPTFTVGESRPRLLKTPHAERYKNDWKMPMWAVALATSAAPTYLPAFEYEGKTYIDGGVWANNPSLIGLIEAKDLGAKLSNIKILNIGTTFTNSESMYWKPFFIKTQRSGLISWARQILSTVMDANGHATSEMYAHQLLDKGNLFVINKQVDRGEFDLDKIDNKKFTEMGGAAGEEFFPKLEVAGFFHHTAKPYSPNKKAIGHD